MNTTMTDNNTIEALKLELSEALTAPNDAKHWFDFQKRVFDIFEELVQSVRDEDVEIVKKMKKRGKSYWTVKEVDKKGKTGTLNPVGSMARGYVDGYNKAIEDVKSKIKEAL